MARRLPQRARLALSTVGRHRCGVAGCARASADGPLRLLRYGSISGCHLY
jgi:hypothetical protein